jgi:quercetin dioxygenase-like cupin family protein
VTLRQLLPDTMDSLNVERMEFPPESRLVGIPHRSGTREYLTCESGEIELAVAGEQWKLSPGDVAVFRGDQKHSYATPGRKTAVGYSVLALGKIGD